MSDVLRNPLGAHPERTIDRRQLLRRGLTLGLGAGLASAFLAACAPSPAPASRSAPATAASGGAKTAKPSAESPTIRMTYQQTTGSVLWIVAIEKGFFKELGLTFKTKTEASGKQAMEGLIAGQTDLVTVPASRIILAADKKLPVTAIALASYGFSGSVVVPARDQSTKTLQDLRGKRIGAQVGSETYTALVRYLKSQGLKATDFKMKNMDTPLVPTALESGEIEAGLVWPPISTSIINKGLARELIGAAAISDPIKLKFPSFLLTSTAFVEKYPEATQRVVNAWLQATRFVDKNHDETVELMLPVLKNWGFPVPADQLKAELYSRKYDQSKITQEMLDDAAESAKVMLESGSIKSVPDLTPLYTNRFVEKVDVS